MIINGDDPPFRVSVLDTLGAGHGVSRGFIRPRAALLYVRSAPAGGGALRITQTTGPNSVKVISRAEPARLADETT